MLSDAMKEAAWSAYCAAGVVTNKEAVLEAVSAALAAAETSQKPPVSYANRSCVGFTTPTPAPADRGAVEALPVDATPAMVAAALAVDWTNENEEATVHNVWHAMIAALALPAAEGVQTCPVCAEMFKSSDLCATDIEMGTCHAACLEGSPVVDLDTGEPIDGTIHTYRFDDDGTALPAAEVKVKPLEWAKADPVQRRDILVPAFRADTIIGRYQLEFDGRKWFGTSPCGYLDDLGEFCTLESAKTAAQADHDTRILQVVNFETKPLGSVASKLKSADVVGTLEECEDYFDNRADADCDQDGFIPNTEMQLLEKVRVALAALSALAAPSQAREG